MDPDLTPDEQALLDQIAPDTTLDELGGGGRRGATTSPVNDEDDIVFGDEPPADDEHPAGYVPKAEFDRLEGEISGLRKLFSAREAPQFAPAPPTFAPPPVAPGPPQMSPDQLKAQREELAAKFFEDPIAFTNAIAQNAVAQERKQNESRHVETTASIARAEVSRIRDEVARDFPQYKTALPGMDKLMAETDPSMLASLMSAGKLRDVYMSNFKAQAFDVANRVNSAAIARRRPAGEEPPQLGGRGLASVSAIDKIRSGSKVVRMSDLDEVDREAVMQMRKLKFSDAEIKAALAAG